VAEEPDGPRPEGGGERAVDRGELLPHHGKAFDRGDAPAADELDGEAARGHGGADLGACAVDDHDALARPDELADLRRCIRGARAAALDDEDAHVRYSALIRT